MGSDAGQTRSQARSNRPRSNADPFKACRPATMGSGMGVNGGDTGNADRADWDRLLSEQIRQNGRFFFRLAHNVLRDAQLAEDVCQQALLRAWEERDRIQPGPTLKAWLARTVVNNSLQLVRRGKGERRGGGEPAAPPPAGGGAGRRRGG